MPINDIELEINEAKKLVEIRDALKSLMDDPRFKLVILEEYFTQEAVRLVHLKAASPVSTPEGQAAVLRSIDGIGELKQFLSTLWMRGDSAEDAIEAGEQELASMNEEGEG